MHDLLRAVRATPVPSSDGVPTCADARPVHDRPVQPLPSTLSSVDARPVHDKPVHRMPVPDRLVQDRLVFR